MIPWEVTQRSKVKQQVSDRPRLRAPDVEKQCGYPSEVQKLSQSSPEDRAVCVPTSLPCLSLALQRPNWSSHALWLIVPQFHSFMLHPARILFHWVLPGESLNHLLSDLLSHPSGSPKRSVWVWREQKENHQLHTSYRKIHLHLSLSLPLFWSSTLWYLPQKPTVNQPVLKTYCLSFSLSSVSLPLSLPELQHSSLHPWFNPVPLDCCS